MRQLLSKMRYIFRLFQYRSLASGPKLQQNAGMADLGKTLFNTTKDWFFSLPNSRRQIFLDWAKRNKKALTVTTGLSGFLSARYYYKHLQETPITKRRRFIALTTEQFTRVCQKEVDEMREKYSKKGLTLSPDDPRMKRVVYVMNNLISRNRMIPEIKNIQWHICIIDCEEKHGKAISTGYIFISTGLLKHVANDDQLGIHLSHEMAHAILQHDLEKVSWSMLMQTVVEGVMHLAATLSPIDLVDKFFNNARDKIIDIISTLPYGRMLEQEADEIGLQLAARACFDFREAYTYWSGFTPNPNALDMNPLLAKWIYHHPNYGDRSERLEQLMEQMCDIRSKAGCTPLTDCDPCAILAMKRKLGKMDEAMAKGCPLDIPAS